MNERTFIEDIAEIIEADPKELTLDSDFRKSADYWSSLTGFGILVYLQDKYDVNIDVDYFLELNTIKELYEFCKG